MVLLLALLALAAPAAVQHSDAQAAAPLAERSLATYQEKLLDTAFRAASAMPVFPHIKNRSRAQEEVVAAWLELGQPRHALARIDEIADWRRGACYADLAFTLAQDGATEQVPHYLELAEKVADQLKASIDAQGEEDDSPIESAQDWQRDRIRVRIAQVHVLLGRQDKVQEFAGDAVDSEFGKVAALEAGLASDEAFSGTLEALDATALNGSLDRVRNALDGYGQLYARFYPNEERRTLVEQRIRDAWGKTPRAVRVEVLVALADSALAHADNAKALGFHHEASALIGDGPWDAEELLRIQADLARLRARAGETREARIDLDQALGRYDTLQDQIPDIYRAEALRPLAEAYQALGDGAQALVVYKRALEAGATNPNARPRAEDLAATCRSMAVSRMEPDAALWESIARVQASLVEPW